MTCVIDLLQEVFRECETVRVVKSQTVNTGPCWLFNVVVAADNDQDLLVSVYDGVDTAGSIELDFFGAEDKAFSFPFMPPIHFRYGIYVAMQGDIRSVVCTFLQDVPRTGQANMFDLFKA